MSKKIVNRVNRFKLGDVINHQGNKLLIIGNPDKDGDILCLELEITNNDAAWENYGNLINTRRVAKEYRHLLKDNNNTFGWYLSKYDYDYDISKVKNTRLAKKLFPKANESEDGEWLYV